MMPSWLSPLAAVWARVLPAEQLYDITWQCDQGHQSLGLLTFGIYGDYRGLRCPAPCLRPVTRQATLRPFHSPEHFWTLWYLWVPQHVTRFAVVPPTPSRPLWQARVHFVVADSSSAPLPVIGEGPTPEAAVAYAVLHRSRDAIL